VRFTACDRWLSVRLREGQDQDDAPAAFPLFEDPSHLQGDSRPPRFWRFTPSTGTALVVTRELADEQEAVLRAVLGRSRPWLRSDHGYYSSFVFQAPMPYVTPELVWSGCLLLR
ncbi:MAG: hypothetical protein PHR35_04530, partial [Kiritimatiellae bacterium]|nr:hypothetical protein [Kiritimatiellia bacterium]